jgi:hypothetical protein
MDMFGDDDDDDNGNEANGAVSVVSNNSSSGTSSVSSCGLMQQVVSEIFIEIVKNKNALKKSVVTEEEEETGFGADAVDCSTEIILNRHVAVLAGAGGQPSSTSLLTRLKAAKFANATMINDTSAQQSQGKYFDVVAICDIDSSNMAKFMKFVELKLLPGGLLLLPVALASQYEFRETRWLLHRSNSETGGGSKDNTTVSGNGTAVVRSIRKCSVGRNLSGAPYWAKEANKQLERELLEQITVAMSVSERSMGLLSDQSHNKAVLALQKHGVVVFRGLFCIWTLMVWGVAAQKDMTHVINALKHKGLEFLDPHKEGQWIENYHEMSMREAYRCDLRNGTEMKKLQAALNHDKTSSGDNSDTDSSFPTCSFEDDATDSVDHTGNDISTFTLLNSHPAIRDVLQQVMNPPPENAEVSKGNWGRYNFGAYYKPGTGPPPVKVGNIGCVMSVPGCIDQTIHADTAHIYEHIQLPGHYYNLFIPAVTGPVQTSDETGQTAFIAGSHILDTCTDMMVRECGEAKIEANLLRPQLYCGDALIFDCRILHFGLANQVTKPTSSGPSNGAEDPPKSNMLDYEWHEDWRPLLYMNHTQYWFSDPKNWNDAEKLFSSNC